MTTGSIGFRTRTAKAIAIAVADDGSPRFIQRWNLELWDPEVPATTQPHHEVMELPWETALVDVRRYEELIADVATKCLQGLLDTLRSSGIRVRCVGIFGSPDRNLEKIGNRHIRAHAAEGALFRRAVETAAARCKVSSRNFSDRAFEATAMKELRCTPATMKRVLGDIGRAAGRPWRADERAAAAAAWIALDR